MLRGATIGINELNVSHLQFTDDTIIFLEPKMEYRMTSRRILRCFELVSGLWINFHKSCIVKVGRKGERNVDWAAAFRCKSASLPITYLGLPLGASPGTKAFWNSVIGNGGLSIGRILDKNMGLLANWAWRFGTEVTSLWKAVICAKYGVQHWMLLWNWKSETNSSHFVRAVRSLFDEGSLVAKILNEGIITILGYGDKVNFWSELKWDNISLSEAFPRIYALAKKKCGVVQDFGR
ncbi:hypothetical protein Dsin_016680 [Dipteronia sinensis]|uniref:Reverse transcriptase domain-containing protein n=1 Tax=Dipteronia sinensis TaxID=43782 RepID=A0AAE0ADN6_9ROSI|nr:hypothetical protein Dsin_016680 [Dipteronia sinensis]